MKIEEAKDQILNLYNLSLTSDFQNIKEHPIRIIEASKSIIGINQEKPLLKLIDYCKQYVNQFKSKKIDFNTKISKIPEVVTYHDLELSLIKKDLNKSYKTVYYLSCVSDGKQVLEFLLQFSLKYCSESFLLVWSIYRMQQFRSFEGTLDALLVSVKYIINDMNEVRSKIDEEIENYCERYIPDYSTYDIFYNLFRIYNEELTRKEMINPFIVSTIIQKCQFEDIVNKNFNCKDNQYQLGRSWVLEYLKNLKINQLNPGIIINLDAARGSLKIENKVSNIKRIWTNLNRIL